jgi:hypothetical protein
MKEIGKRQPKYWKCGKEIERKKEREKEREREWTI